jgi:hypothetical protein
VPEPVPAPGTPPVDEPRPTLAGVTPALMQAERSAQRGSNCRAVTGALFIDIDIEDLLESRELGCGGADAAM